MEVTTPTTTPATSGLATALQYALAIGLPFIIGKGWVSANDAANIAVAVPAVAAAGYGVFKSIKHSKEKHALVNGTATIVSK